MKSQPLRKEKNCLNCGTEVPERYCTHCGQENTVPHETFTHLVKHFVADIFHYDSQFLTTLKYLLFRPGFLSREYMAGKRVRYVNPIKLYVFISFVFFFGLFTLQHGNEKESGEFVTERPLAQVNNGDNVKTGIETLDQALSDSSPTSIKKNMNRYHTVEEFDAAQRQLPDSARLHGAEKSVYRRIIGVRQKYGEDSKKAIIEMFNHNVPKLMFVLLPLFALFMTWMYRKQKKWLYADHAIFAIHLHSFSFIIGLTGLLLEFIFHNDIFMTIGWWIIFIYLVLALWNNYRQSFRKSLLKGIVLSIAYGMSTGIVFLIYILLMFMIFL
ncbi:DUF3667 domain-containing protein [Chitinophaga sp. RCC_12]|uniref:DUF3667 domain-containing protein n=1 Tax=Chitinophaga sp. RCC_12 TaxID=3239226 RepID=UPI003523B1E2